MIPDQIEDRYFFFSRQNQMSMSLVAWGIMIFCHSLAAFAGDWPQILGPARNGVALEEKIVEAFPENGPPVLWQRKVGSGFAGVAVSGKVAILYHRVDRNDVVEALDAESGKPIWKQTTATTFNTPYTDDDGPRAVPVIHEGTVIVFSAQGVLSCYQLEGGKLLWSRNTHAEYGAPEGYFGAASSPIIVGKNVVVNVGSARGAGVVAFDLETGKTVWKQSSELASYSSPVVTTVVGKPCVIFITRLKILALDPESGTVRFEFPFGKRGPTVNAASPVVFDSHLFATSHYGVGARFYKLSDKDQKVSASLIWEDDDTLSAHYMTPIAFEKHLYGVHGQERIDDPEMRCVDPYRHKVLWSKPAFGYGSILLADKKLIALTTTGDLILVRPNPQRYTELGRAKVFDSTTRALPALSNGRLYARDTRTLKCFDLRMKNRN